MEKYYEAEIKIFYKIENKTISRKLKQFIGKFLKKGERKLSKNLFCDKNELDILN